MPDKLAVSVREAAALLGLSPKTVYQLTHQEGFPSFKLGERTLVSVDGLREWVRDRGGRKAVGACDLK